MKPTFDLLQPTRLDEALTYIGEKGVHLLAGGTALVRFMKADEVAPVRLVSLHRLKEELGGIHAMDGGFSIGALATLTDIEQSPLVLSRASVIVRTLRILATPRVRNAATLGGHLAQAEPQTDLPTILLSLGARIRVQSRSGERWMEIPDLFVATHRNSLSSGEIITEVHVPTQKRCAAYAKCTTISQSHDWPALGIAVNFDVLDGLLHDSRVALGAAIPHPVRLTSVEAILDGQAPGPELFARAGAEAARTVAPFSDIRASASYKKAVIPVYVRRALQSALEGK